MMPSASCSSEELDNTQTTTSAYVLEKVLEKDVAPARQRLVVSACRSLSVWTMLG